MSRFLQVGSVGQDVAEIQRALGVHDDGIFGVETQAAVINYQCSSGLTQDGVVGPDTFEAIRAHRCTEIRSAAQEIGTDGWYARARKVAAHPARVGLVIAPWAIVVHTTD